MISVETLVEKEVCVSRAEARRLIAQGVPEWKLEKMIQHKEEQKWGRRPRKINLVTSDLVVERSNAMVCKTIGE